MRTSRRAWSPVPALQEDEEPGPDDPGLVPGVREVIVVREAGSGRRRHVHRPPGQASTARGEGKRADGLRAVVADKPDGAVDGDGADPAGSVQPVSVTGQPARRRPRASNPVTRVLTPLRIEMNRRPFVPGAIRTSSANSADPATGCHAAGGMVVGPVGPADGTGPAAAGATAPRTSAADARNARARGMCVRTIEMSWRAPFWRFDAVRHQSVTGIPTASGTGCLGVSHLSTARLVLPC